MTVQELIDELMKVEDKSKKVVMYTLNEEEEKHIVDVQEYNENVLLYDY